mgnify:CR=1
MAGYSSNIIDDQKFQILFSILLNYIANFFDSARRVDIYTLTIQVLYVKKRMIGNITKEIFQDFLSIIFESFFSQLKI